jgi:hypothetical protein
LKALGRATETVTSLLAALSIRPEYAKTHQELGKTLLDIGDPDAAVVHLLEARRINPNAQQLQEQLVEAHSKQSWISQTLTPRLARCGQLNVLQWWIFLAGLMTLLLAISWGADTTTREPSMRAIVVYVCVVNLLLCGPTFIFAAEGIALFRARRELRLTLRQMIGAFDGLPEMMFFHLAGSVLAAIIGMHGPYALILFGIAMSMFVYGAIHRRLHLRSKVVQGTILLTVAGTIGLVAGASLTSLDFGQLVWRWGGILALSGVAAAYLRHTSPHREIKAYKAA